MTAKEQVIADLLSAEDSFNRVLGKHTYEEAFALLVELQLCSEAETMVLELIETCFARDAFAGYLRYDAITNRIHVEAIRLNRLELVD